MEQEMKHNWDFIKGVIQINKQSSCHPYVSNEDIKIFENKMKKSMRFNKLKRILNIN